MCTISKNSLARNGDEQVPETDRAARAMVLIRARELIAFAYEQAEEGALFESFEKTLIGHAMGLVRAVIVLFLVASETRIRRALNGTRQTREGREFRVAPPQQRNLMTWFGIVRYARTYLREVVRPGEAARGYHPLDAELGLLADRISPNVLSITTRLSTRVSYAEAREVAGWFLPEVPSTEVIEGAVLGYGSKTQEWFEEAPAPEDDGEVLVIQIDSKGVPTATDEELRKRRGKRSRRKKAPSPRHRNRQARQRRTKKPRRAKGDKAKNAKMGTMVVMYTLRRQPRGDLLLGPINKWHYASFAPKRHAVEVARREATKRGFEPDTRRVIQIVTDGDNDLALYAAELFPNAIRTIDVIHVIEKLWDAGSALHGEGSAERDEWVERQKAALYDGLAIDIVAEIDRQLAGVPRTGPGNKSRREKLTETRNYIEKRLGQMTYRDLRRQDLELGTGVAEGAVKNLMGQRLDKGGMRWIRERAEALLQLRCIDANGDWGAFTAQAHAAMRHAAITTGVRPRLQKRSPSPLPVIAEAA